MIRSRAALVAALFAGLLAVGWWLLAPTSVGGRATYVLTHGVSMEPTFHTGDLAVVYPSSHYRVGEVVAYRSELLHTVVLHRIVARDGDRFVFKGDNNTWRDPEHPSSDQLVGRLGLHLPRGGLLLGWLHNPYLTGPLALAIAVIGATSARSRRRRRRARAEKRPMSLHLPRMSWTKEAIVAGVGALAFAGLTVASFVTPAQTQVTAQVPWSEGVSYGYTATTTPSTVYPDGHVHTGQTVFRNLVDQLRVRATWSLHTEAAHHTAGTASLQAVLHSDSGWSHPLALARSRAFTGDQVQLTGTLDLPRLDRLSSHAARLTGIPSDSYTLTVRPRVHLHGSLAGQPLDSRGDRAVHPLTLQVSPTTVTTAAQSPAASGSHPEDTPLATSTISHTGTVLRPAPAAWTLFGHRISLGVVRAVGAVGAGCLLAVSVLLLLAKRGPSHRCRDAARYRHSIVPVQHLSVAETRTVVDVTTIGALARIAQRYDRLILEQVGQPGTYLVEDESTLYRFQCQDPHGQERVRRHAEPPRHATGTS